MTARSVSLLVGLPLFAASLGVLAGSGGGSRVEAATATAPHRTSPNHAIVLTPHPLTCPSHGLLGTPRGPEADKAGAVARAFVSAWWQHEPKAAVAVSDPVFRQAARRLATGPRRPQPGVRVVRVTGLAHDPAGPGLALHCGKPVLESARIAVVRVLHGSTITAGIYLIRRPGGYRVWAVR